MVQSVEPRYAIITSEKDNHSMFIPSPERQREIAADARRYAQVFRLALDYVEAGQAQTGEALLNAIPPDEPHPEEREWAIDNAVRRIREIAAAEQDAWDAAT
jgi:hypothetical protein